MQTKLHLIKTHIMETTTEQLEIIAKAINQTKENVHHQRPYYLLWGWLVVVSSGLHFALLEFTDFTMPWLPWMIVMPVGGIVSAILGYKQEKTAAYKTYLDRALSIIWISLGIGFIVAVVACVLKGVSPSIFTLLLAGIGTFASGRIMKFKPLVVGGILLFAGSIACLFLDPSYQLLVNAIAIFLGYIIPATLIKSPNGEA